MTIADCPKCREQVTVPTHASSQALVQCPYCSEEYELGDALAGLPPALIVIEDAEAPPLATGHVGLAATPPGPGATDLAASDDLEESADETSLPAFQVSGYAAPPSPKPATGRVTRSRRRPISPTRQFVQIVAGGVAGIVLAQLILWWIPVNISVSNRDLTGFGRQYGHYVPFLVPASVRHAGRIDTGRGPATDSLRTEGDVASAVASTSGGIRDFEFAQDRAQGDPAGASENAARRQRAAERNRQRTQPQTKANETRESGVATISGGLELSQLPEMSDEQRTDARGAGLFDSDLAVPSIKLDLAVRSNETSATGQSGGPAASPTAGESSEPSVPGGRSFTQSDVGQRLSDALAANVSWDIANNPDVAEKRRMAAEFYSAFAGLGEALAFVDHEDSNVSERIPGIINLLERIGQQPEKLKLVAAGAPSWIDNPRPHNGVFLVGRVKGIERDAAFFTTRLQLDAKDDRVVNVISTKGPWQNAAVNQHIFVLGSILDDPADNLPGYMGQLHTAVVSGLYVPLDDG